MKKPDYWEDSKFASESLAAQWRGPHPVSKALLFLILAFFVALGAWAHYAEIDEVTHGEGKVVPSSQVQVIQNLEGGIMKEILVREGALVERGQILLRLDDTSFSSLYGEKQAVHISILAAVARLTAETEGADTVTFPSELRTTAPDVVAAEKDLFEARKAELNSRVAILKRQAEQRHQEINEIRSRLSHLRSSLKLAKEERDITEPMVKKGIVSQVIFLRLKREINNIEGEIKTIKLALPRALAATEEAKRRVEEKTLAFRSEAQRELNYHRSELSVLDETIRGLKDRLLRTEVLSPVKGVVKELKVRTVGGVIKPGQDLVEIVPLEDTLLVEAKIRPRDIAFIHPDQKTTVKLSAYDYSIYGGLDANVERISADTLMDENGQPYYRVMLRTDKNHLTYKGKTLPIIPGMIATVDVLTGRKTILDYLLKPILKTKQNALRER